MSTTSPEDATPGVENPVVEDGTPTILVVDDEPALLRLMAFLLKRQGYRLITATNGEEALLQLQEHRPDLVVLDIMMPKMDGYEVTERLRADPDRELAATPILMLSAKAQDEDIVRGLEAGSEAYVTKPFDPEMLTNAVAAMLRGEAIPDSPTVTQASRTVSST
jgi:DNA-binding response OmpR family regulator